MKATITGFVLSAILLVSFAYSGGLSTPVSGERAEKIQFDSEFGKLPLGFEKNLGQFDSQVRYAARGRQSSVFLVPSGFVFQSSGSSSDFLTVSFGSASGEQLLAGEKPSSQRVNYFVGNMPSRWLTNVPVFSEVRYSEICEGVDLRVYGNEREFEFDLEVGSSADQSCLVLSYEGQQSLALDEEGDLEIHFAEGRILKQGKPLTYQLVNGRKQEVKSHYLLVDDQHVQVAVGQYDPTIPLIIDPVISFSTFLGGTGEDKAHSIVVDSQGNSYIVGETRSKDFPVGEGTGVPGSSSDIFVSKLNPTGDQLLFTTFIGGSGADRGFGISVDRDDEIYLTGSTDSFNFPTTNGAFQKNRKGPSDAVIVKLGSSGDEVVFSSYFGGVDADTGYGINVDEDGNPVFVGATSSGDFPVSDNAFQPERGSPSDAFVTKVSSSGLVILFSTFLGGSGIDEAFEVRSAADGSVHVVGRTLSQDFPTFSAFQNEAGGRYDGFLATVSGDGTDLLYSTYIGGDADDAARGVAFDNQGNVFAAGSTRSSNFPLQSAFQETLGGESDAFILQVNQRGAGLLLSSYLGGSKNDVAFGLAIDNDRDLYLTGSTDSANFPLKDSIQNSLAGLRDVFIAKVTTLGNELVYSTYIGGSNDDIAEGIALFTGESVVIAGTTNSSDFPVDGGFEESFGGVQDAFVTKVSATNSLNFAQFGDGSVGGTSIRSQIRIYGLNSTVPTKIRVNLTSSDGNPMSVELNGEMVNGVQDYLIPAGGLLNLESSGSGPLTVGSVRVTADTAIGGVILFRSSVGVAGVGDSKLARRFVAPVEIREGFDTGLAIMNLGRFQRVRVDLIKADGTKVADAGIDLVEDGQVARFLTELDWNVEPDFSNFVGTAVVYGNGDLAGTVLLLTPEGLTTQPVSAK